MAKRAHYTEKELLWEIAKADNEAQRRQHRYDAAIERLAYWVNSLKVKYPDSFNNYLKTDTPITTK